MAASLRRSAYSTNIKTRADFSCAFFDNQMRAIAQAFAQPSHLGSLVRLVPAAIRDYGADRIGPGRRDPGQPPVPRRRPPQRRHADRAVLPRAARSWATSRASRTTSTWAAARRPASARSGRCSRRGSSSRRSSSSPAARSSPTSTASSSSRSAPSARPPATCAPRSRATTPGSAGSPTLVDQLGARALHRLPRRAARLHRPAHRGRAQGAPPRRLRGRRASSTPTATATSPSRSTSRSSSTTTASCSTSAAPTSSGARRSTRPTPRPTPTAPTSCGR